MLINKHEEIVSEEMFWRQRTISDEALAKNFLERLPVCCTTVFHLGCEHIFFSTPCVIICAYPGAK